ncbi:YrzI family small protein [Pseudomonas sp. 2822-17]
MFHFFFVTVNITKRKFTGEDVKREEKRATSRKMRQEMRAKQSEYIRLL